MDNEVDVLVVGSDHAVAGGILGLLRKRELTLDYAGNCVEAIRLLARNPFKVVLLDGLFSPDCGDVLSFIDSLPERPRVILMSTEEPASLDPSVESSVLRKPVDLEQLAGYVQVAAMRPPGMTGTERS